MDVPYLKNATSEDSSVFVYRPEIVIDDVVDVADIPSIGIVVDVSGDVVGFVVNERL